MGRERLSLTEARRIALAAQGFDRPRPRRAAGLVGIRRVIHRLGLLQIDYVNVLVPAQYQVLFSRLGTYDRAQLDDLIYRRREFTEQWAREASIVPVTHWPLLRQSVNERRERFVEQFVAEHAGYVARVLEHIRERGPVPADALPQPEGVPKQPRDWWGWTIPKAAMEAHFTRGIVAVADRRPDFARVYDLTERIIPAEHHGRSVSPEEARRALLLQAARAHGVGTASDLADYYRLPIRAARRQLDELVAEGELRDATVEGWRELAYLDPHGRVPTGIEANTLLSPFDPVVWFRPRGARLFDFDYVLEIWVPKAKRRWGYYVLPFLFGERLAARVDLKADRAHRRLLVQAAYRETHAKAAEVAPALAVELRAWVDWLGLEDIAVERRGDLAPRLAAAVRALS
jgi:uncharacterized protein